MKTHFLFIICLLFVLASYTEVNGQNVSSEESLQKTIDQLSQDYTTKSDFEKNYRVCYIKSQKIKASKSTFTKLLQQRLQFYYYNIDLDTVKYYSKILKDEYRRTKNAKYYFYVQAMWADINTSSGRIGEALNIGSQMLREAAASHEDIGLAYGAYSLAIAYFTMGNHRKAIPYFKQAIPIFYKYKSWSTYFAATCNYIGSLTTIKEYKLAEKMLFQLDNLINKSESSKEHFVSEYNIANVNGIIATQLYNYSNNKSKAKYYLDKTEKLYNKYPYLNRVPLMQARLQYATVSKNYKNQLIYADSLIKYYNNDISNSYRMYNYKSVAYEGLGNYKMSLKELKRYNEIKDSVYDKDALSQMTRFAAEYGTYRLKVEKAEMALQMKDRQAHFYFIIIVVVAIMLITIALFVMYLLKMNSRQKKMIAIKDDFIRNVSHEIRTPLNYIVGFSDVIAGSVSDNKEMTGLTKKIHQGSDELLKMFDDMIILSDNSTGGRELSLEDTNIDDICISAIESMSDFLNDSTTIKYDNSNTDAVITTDKMKLRYVMYNLLHNAVKFTERGKVKVSVFNDDSQCVIRVSDTGKGIKPESVKLLFNSFYKEDKFTQGLGLGLTNARTAVEQLGGTLTLNSEYKDGAEFVVTLYRRDLKK